MACNGACNIVIVYKVELLILKFDKVAIKAKWIFLAKTIRTYYGKLRIWKLVS